MKIAIALVAFAGLAVPAAPALAAPAAHAPTPTTSPTPTASPTPAVNKPAPTGSPVIVARYTFDAGAVDGHVADTSGKGSALTVRAADQGAVRFENAAGGGRYVAFPVLCRTVKPCPRSLLEAPSTANLNPGTRTFRWSARVQVTKAQVKGSANVMQKGVATTGSQWKMQIGATQGRAQCVVVGTGSKTTYLARSSATVADGQWHTVLCERSGTALRVSVDGQVRGTATVPATLSIANTLPMRIGGANFNTASAMFHGSLDDVYAELG